MLVAGCGASDPSAPPGGTCGGAEYPAWETSDYALPYPVGESDVVLQGNCGSFSHQTTMERYGYDFDMPIGEAVVAVRAGRVHRTEARSSDDDRVEAGDTLGCSGNSRFSTQHHLDVLTDCVDGAFRSVPTTFQNAGENPNGLVQDRT